MYAYLKGEIAFRSPAFVVIDVQGVGYHVNIPLSTYSALQGLEKTTLYTHLHVREDAHTLYGFATQVERNLFLQLLGVTGVGANTALLIMSSLTADEIRAAIIGEQAHVLQRIKGIGAKTAKQIILDLKDRLLREAPDSPVLFPTSGAGNTLREEALSALLALGFNRIAVQKALNSVLQEQPGIAKVEDLIKATLRTLS